MPQYEAHVAYWDKEMCIRASNDGFARFVGRPGDEIAGRSAREILGEDLYELNLPYANLALGGQQQRFYRAAPLPDGGARHVEALFVPDRAGDEISGFWAIVTEVDPERAAAGSPAESVYRMAFFASPVGKAIFDEAGQLLQVNPALAHTVGEDPDALVGRRLVELLDPPEQDRESARLAALFAGVPAGEARECRIAHQDGRSVWVLLSLALAKPTRRRGPLGIAQFQNIAAKREAEDRLRESRERLIEAERVAGIGSWELDLRTGQMHWSAGLYSIFGKQQSEDPVWLEDGLNERVYVEDRQLAKDTLERALVERTGFDIQPRIVRGDGRIRVLEVHGEVIVDTEGQPIRVIGIAKDVTERVSARDALAQAGADMALKARELQGLADGLADQTRPHPGARELLSARQLEIMTLIAQGHTNGSIARRLYLSEATVKWHIKQILAKTGAANRAEAVAKVFKDNH